MEGGRLGAGFVGGDMEGVVGGRVPWGTGLVEGGRLGAGFVGEDMEGVVGGRVL
ncbi:MAG: hypothetical protein PHC41_00365 [Lachnospiraceae bacterium]|nr:hypothetical protein [Lachnospiraceae bacterium]